MPAAITLTSEQMRLFRRMWTQREPPTDISATFGMSLSSVYSMAFRLGCARRVRDGDLSRGRPEQRHPTLWRCTACLQLTTRVATTRAGTFCPRCAGVP